MLKKPSKTNATSTTSPIVSTKILYILFGGGLVLISILVLGLVLLQRQANNVIPSSALLKVEATNRPEKPTFATDFGIVPAIRDTDIVFGDRNAALVLYEYADLECPFCKTFQTTLNALETKFSGNLAVVFRHFPLTIHPSAPMEGQVLACVSSQNMEAARALIVLNYKSSQATGTSFTVDQYLDLAAEAGANRVAVANCYADGSQKHVVEEDRAEAISLGLNVTPSTLLVRKTDGRAVQIKGAYGLGEMQQAVLYLLP